MNTYYLALAAAVLAGAVLPLQSLINAQLGTYLHGSSWAAAASALVSTFVLLLLSPALTGSPSLTGALRGAPLWMWLGGVLGALYLFVAIQCVRPLGAAGLVAAVVFGQLSGALALDTAGVLREAVPLSWQRVLGCLLAFAGVWLVARQR